MAKIVAIWVCGIISFAIVMLIIIKVVNQWNTMPRTSVSAAAQAAQQAAKPCDKPAETYLLNAQELLGYSGKLNFHSEEGIGTTASAWIQFYQVCSQIQKESAR